jgi:FMN phosphatase YigB (HAD superfamily)
MGIGGLLGVDHHRLAERLGLRCEACVFVDDLAHNLEPARALGMTAIQKTSAGQLLDELEGLLRIPLR